MHFFHVLRHDLGHDLRQGFWASCDRLRKLKKRLVIPNLGRTLGREDLQLGGRSRSFLGSLRDVRSAGMERERMKKFSLSDALAEAREDQEHRTHCWVRKLTHCWVRKLTQFSSSSSSANQKENEKLDQGPVSQGSHKYLLTHEVRRLVRSQGRHLSRSRSPKGQKEGEGKRSKEKINREERFDFKRSSFSDIKAKAYGKFVMRLLGTKVDLQNCGLHVAAMCFLRSVRPVTSCNRVCVLAPFSLPLSSACSFDLLLVWSRPHDVTSELVNAVKVVQSSTSEKFAAVLPADDDTTFFTFADLRCGYFPVSVCCRQLQYGVGFVIFEIIHNLRCAAELIMSDWRDWTQLVSTLLNVTTLLLNCV